MENVDQWGLYMIVHKNIGSRRQVTARGHRGVIVARRVVTRKNLRCDRIIKLSHECDQVYELVKGWSRMCDCTFPKGESSIRALSSRLAKVQAAVAAYKNTLTDVISNIIESA